MSTQTMTKSRRNNKMQGKVEMILMGSLILLLAAAVFFTSAGTGSKSPTGFASKAGLSIEETKQQANFDIPLLTELPFTATKEIGEIAITKYGSEEVHRVSIQYLNENTSEELYVVYSKLDKDLQDYQNLATEVVQLSNGKEAKYGIVGFGEGLTWVQDGVFYGIYNHIHKDQKTLGVDKLIELSKNLMK